MVWLEIGICGFAEWWIIINLQLAIADSIWRIQYGGHFLVFIRFWYLGDL